MTREISAPILATGTGARARLDTKTPATVESAVERRPEALDAPELA
jgi:hypothetical protein